MSHKALDYSRWDDLEEPSDDEDTGACIGLPGRDGGPGTVYRWEELRTELPWQHQRPDDEPVVAADNAGTSHAGPATLPAGGSGSSLKHEELPATAPAAPASAASVAPAETAAPPAEPPPAATEAERMSAQQQEPPTAAEPVGATVAEPVGASIPTSTAPLRIRCARHARCA